MTALALALLSALLYTACFPPFELPLTWIALVPLLAAIDRPGAARAALASAVWGAATTASVVAWLLPTLTGYFERSLPVAFGVFAIVAATALAPWFAGAFAVQGAARDRLPRALWLALFPAAWVSAEYTRTQLGLRSSWALLGAAHFESARLRQIADVTAVYGVSALVALGNVVAYEALRLAVDWRAWRWRRLSDPIVPVGAAFALLLGATLVYGERRRFDPAAAADRPEIVLVQGAVDAELRWQRSAATRMLRRYADLSQSALRDGAAPPVLVIWPENAIQTEPGDAVYGPALRSLVASLRVPVLLGAPRSEAGRSFNTAHLLEPGGATRYYDKMRLLPFSETPPPFGVASRGDLDAATYAAGTEPGLFDVAGERIGVLICFEAIYPDLARALAARGATALVNLSNDGWYRGRGGARQHLQQVVFRAIETGLPVLRATTTGVTAVVAPDGAIVATLATGEPGALRARLPKRRLETTFYARVGDAFAWACIAASLAGLAAAATLGVRRAPVSDR